jgi:hypothetical protein
MAVFETPEDAVPAALGACEAAGGVQIGGQRRRRVAAAAGSGEVVISDAVRERLPQPVATRRKWRFSGKGTPAGMKAYAVE